MKNLTRNILALAMAAMLAISCKEDVKVLNDNAEKLKSVGWWKLVALQVGSNDVPIDGCVSDNTFKFDVNNEYIQDEGATKCDPDDKQTQTGEWSLTSNGNGLTITLDGSTKLTSISALTAQELILTYNVGELAFKEKYEPN